MSDLGIPQPMARIVVQMKSQTLHWRLPWRDRLRVAICVLLGWTFTVEGDFTCSHDLAPGDARKETDRGE